MPAGSSDDLWIGAKHDPALALPQDPNDPEFQHNNKTELPAVYEGQATLPTSLDDDPDRVPTEEEMLTLQLQNFIQRPLLTPTGAAPNPGGATDNNPGALGEGQRAATGLSTFFSFWCYVTPLFGAWIADTYLGRYNTIQVSIAIAVVGHVILTAAAAPSVLSNQGGAFAAFIVAIIIFGMGTGGFKPNISPLIAEQIVGDKLRIGYRKDGTKVIIDPAATASRIYNWFYMFINIGAFVGQLSMAYAALYVGYWLAFMLPTLMFLLCPLVLVLCKKQYKLSPPAGSVLGPAFKTLVFASKGRWSINPVRTVKNMRADDFWEAAKPSNVPPERRPKWMTFDDRWVEELRRAFKACTVFLWYPLYWVCYNQINNNLTSQANTMRHPGVPPEIVAQLDPIALMILIPLADLVIYPALRKAGIKFTPIKKIFGGFMCGAAAMVYAAVVQNYIYNHNECGKYPSEGLEDGSDCAPATINIWVQSGCYILIAISEILASITSLEYAFTKAPKNMRSIIQAFALFMTALANAIGEALVVLSEDPLLVWNYVVFACIAFVAGILFWISHRHLDAQEDELNNLDTGHVAKKSEIEDLRRRSSATVPGDGESPQRVEADEKTAADSQWTRH